MFWCNGNWTGMTSWWGPGCPGWMCLMQRDMSRSMCVYVCVQTISATSILKALIAMPGESDDKWSLSCNLPLGGWMELACLVRGWGDEERGDCRWERGGRGKKRTRIRSFLLWTRLWLRSWVSSELRYTFVCVCLSVYLQSFRSCSVHRGGEPLCSVLSPFKPQPIPCEWKHTRAVPTVCEHTFQWETHTYQFDIISEAWANDCYYRDRWSTQHTAH